MEIEVLISACLVGEKCRYDGLIHENKELVRQMRELGIKYVPICPETLGGLSTPREAANIVRGDGYDVLDKKSAVITVSGEDVTEKFIDGAKKVLKLSKTGNIKEAVFNERSPSCGVNFIYNDKRIVKGAGVTTALLEKNGITVISDEDFVKRNKQQRQ